MFLFFIELTPRVFKNFRDGLKEIVDDEIKANIARNKLKKVMENWDNSYYKEKGLAEEKKVDNLFSPKGKKKNKVISLEYLKLKEKLKNN